MKILWHSVAPWVGTGYGQQTATFTPRIAGLGHDLAISAFYGIQGGMMSWNGITCYPAYETGYGTDVVVTHALDHFGDGTMKFAETAAQGVIISLCDVWVLQAPMLANMPVAAWAPVDHITLPEPVRKWFQQTGAAPIAMSRFGQEALAGGLPDIEPFYVPHGIDTTVFRPGDRAHAREVCGVPQDAFIVAMVAANIGKDGHRKAFAEQISAFAEFRAKHTDAVLMLHTDISNAQGNNLFRFLDELPKGSYKYTDQYAYRKGVPADQVAEVYRAADLFTNTSWGEGFGIPIIEAQACGTPVVVTDATAMIELCGAGWRVPYTPLWHESQAAWAAIPHIGSIIDAYDEAYDRAGSMREKAADFAQMYDADFITDTYWAPVLTELEAQLERRRTSLDKPKPTPSAPAWKIFEGDGLLWADRGAGYEDWLGHGNHENYLGSIIPDLLPEGGVFLDVGAHVGHWSLRMAGKASRVISIEANPDTASHLRRNIAINDIQNIEVIERAAWDEPIWLRLDDPNKKTAGGSTRTLPTNGHKDGGVRGDRIDFLVPPLGRLDLVKLDVEGADCHALRGMAGLLARYRPSLFIETHDCYGYYTRAELEQTLIDLGYTWRVAVKYRTTWSPNGTLDEPVEADYLVATPVRDTGWAQVARTAVDVYGAAQHADELANVLDLIATESEDGVLVELGCDRGGSLWAWQHLEHVVYGITLADNSYESGGSRGDIDYHGATVLHGDSHAQASGLWLRDQLGGRRIDVLVLDGDHTVDGIETDLAMYGPLVAPGGLILLHDIRSDTDPRAEVWKVWPRLVDLYDTGEIVSKFRPYGWGIIRVGADGFTPPTGVLVEEAVS